MKKIDACLSHKTDDWKTPTPLYEAFMKKGYIDCFKYQSKEDETKNYYYGKKLFINPPFSKLQKITNWILDQVDNQCTVMLLIPARTDTKYFKELLSRQPLVIFIEGRLHYNDSKAAPFPTVLLVYRPLRLPLQMAVYDIKNLEQLIAWITQTSEIDRKKG